MVSSVSPIVDSVLQLIGNTPLVRLRKLTERGSAEVLAKLEARNPGGSIKDRIALAMIERAEANGRLHPHSIIVEASAGNTGVSLAMVAAAKGYRIVLAIPEDVSPERRRLLSRFGAELVLTSAAEGMAGAEAAAHTLAQQGPEYFRPNAFENPANPSAHQETTAQEVWSATDGRVDALVVGVGTGGSLTGTGRELKSRKPSLLVVAVEPSGSPVLSKGRAGAHAIPGLGASFVPPVLDRSLIDRIVTVSDEAALVTTNRLARQEGLLVGPSSGANVFAALQVARELGAGRTVVTFLPDVGERYLAMSIPSEVKT
ncbi:MAG: cysteine synthase A [Chloroflexi bacterium]|nr:cysteine synthase A [Chloroflexota bacterium]